MTAEPSAANSFPDRVLVRATGGAAYAVPIAVMESHILSPQRRAELQAQLPAASGLDTDGDDALPPDAPVYAITFEELEPYRLSDADLASLDALDEDADVQGFQFIGIFPQHSTTFIGNPQGQHVILTTAPWFIAGLNRNKPYPGLR